MNIVIYTVVILTIFYLLLKKFTTISSNKISKSMRILLVIGLFILAILFAIGGKLLLTLPLTLASIGLLKLKGLSIFQLISLFRLIQTLRRSGRFSFNKSNLNNFIVVGGTQLYIKSLIEGLTFDISKNDDIRKSIVKDLELYGIDHLYSKLKELDSEGAAMISSNDKQRIIRYLEINYMTGQRVSQVFKMKSNQKIQNVDYVKVALSIDRESVNTLINQRVDQMIRDGLVQEVVELKEKYNKKISLLITRHKIPYEGYFMNCSKIKKIGFKFKYNYEIFVKNFIKSF